MTIPTIPLITTTVPPSPNRATDTDQEFSDKGDANLAAWPAITSEQNAMAAGMNDAGVAIDAAVLSAAGSALAANDDAADAAGSVVAAAGYASDANDAKIAAAASAAAAAGSAGSAAGFTATSITSLTIGLGSRTLTLAQAAKSFVVGDFVVVASTANPANFMTGQVTAFNAGTGVMTVNVTGIGGAGTIASWNVALSGQPAAPVTSGTLAGVLNLAGSQSISSAATTDIGAANSNNVTITGTTTITALGTAPEGATRRLLFSGALTLTHNAGSLILPGAANIATAAGDVAEAQSLGSGNWRVTSFTRANGLSVVGSIRRTVKTAGFNAGLADNGAIFELASATAQTMTFTAAATLGGAWSCWWVNTGTGIWTVDPNGSEQIDGVASYVILPGEARLVTCDGTAFKTLIIKPFRYTMTASGTFPILAPGYSDLEGLLWPSGGGGSAGGNTVGGPGGCAAPFRLPAAKLTTAQTVTIGAATSGSNNSSVTAGNDSSFGALLVAPAATTSNRRSTPRGAVSTSSGSPGPWDGGEEGSLNAIYGGAAGGTSTSTAPTSAYAGAGGVYVAGVNGAAGQAPGGGGANASNTFTGGGGARGELRCWGVAA